jgi:hypothetical protein
MGYEAGEMAEMAADRAARIREAAQALLDVLDLPEESLPNSEARLRRLSFDSLPGGELNEFCRAVRALRKALGS